MNLPRHFKFVVYSFLAPAEQAAALLLLVRSLEVLECCDSQLQLLLNRLNLNILERLLDFVLMLLELVQLVFQLLVISFEIFAVHLLFWLVFC